MDLTIRNLTRMFSDEKVNQFVSSLSVYQSVGPLQGALLVHLGVTFRAYWWSFSNLSMFFLARLSSLWKISHSFLVASALWSSVDEYVLYEHCRNCATNYLWLFLYWWYFRREEVIWDSCIYTLLWDVATNITLWSFFNTRFLRKT